MEEPRPEIKIPDENNHDKTPVVQETENTNEKQDSADEVPLAESKLDHTLAENKKEPTTQEFDKNKDERKLHVFEAQLDDKQNVTLDPAIMENVFIPEPTPDFNQHNKEPNIVTNQLRTTEDEQLPSKDEIGTENVDNFPQTDTQVTGIIVNNKPDEKLQPSKTQTSKKVEENTGNMINVITKHDETLGPKLKDSDHEGNQTNKAMLDTLNIDSIGISTEETSDESAVPVAPKEKNCESDTNSDLSSNDEQNNLSSGSTSAQFYETSDSKLDYAVKIEDNDTLSDIDDIRTDTASADSEDSALGSLPPDNTDNTDNAIVSDVSERQQETQDPSDGSDSGIGSEAPDKGQTDFTLSISNSCTKNVVITETTGVEVFEEKDIKYCESKNHAENRQNNENSKAESDDDDKPLAELKRPLRSSLKRKCEEESNEEPKTKKKKEGIKFDNVTVYYFPRAQGFSCVPSQGGSTLGMELEHSHVENFTLAEHALEQRRIHRQVLQQLKNERHALDGISISSSEDSDTEEEASDISESELDLDSYYFLQPVPTRQRRALLRAAGVRKIEPYEKNECRDIRTSREFCGCACKGVCNPESCSCSLAGIKCQVDRLNFPCGCTRDGCSNTTGRIEFNPVRVRTHFIHTLMRLVEKSREEIQSANKRQWGMHNSVPSVQNAAYAQNQCHTNTHEDGILRDVDLTPRVEGAPCVLNGSINNVHNINNRANLQNHLPSNVNFTYGNEPANQKNVGNENHMMHYDASTNHHALVGAYSSNMLQGKGPPYPTNSSIGYDTTSNMQRFPADLNYSYHADNSHYKGVHSYSATSFEEFAHNHNSQMSVFNPYGHMYVNDYLHKQNSSMHTHSSQQYHAMPHIQNHYEIYKSTSECANVVNNESRPESQPNYATMMMPYQNSSKLQTVETDQNWFSQSHETVMEVEGNETTQDASIPHESEAPAQGTQPETTPVNSTAETVENFGELIKKTMVESVTV